MVEKKEAEKKEIKSKDDALIEWGKALMAVGQGLIILSKVIDEIDEIE